MKGLWGSCLEEWERKLNEGEGKLVYIQALTTFGSPETETSVALGIRSIQTFPRAWAEGALRIVRAILARPLSFGYPQKKIFSAHTSLPTTLQATNRAQTDGTFSQL
jgi:hypothetical protein